MQASWRRVWDGESEEEVEEEAEAEERLSCLYLVAVRSALAALGEAGAAEQFAASAAAGLRDCSLEPLLELHCAHPDILLADRYAAPRHSAPPHPPRASAVMDEPCRREVCGAPWACAASSAALAELLAAAVRARGWRLAAHHWDFVTLSLAGLAGALRRSAARWGCSKVALVGVATLRLFASVQRFARGVRAQSERRQPAAHVLALAGEWADVFAPALDAHLCSFTLHVLRQFDILYLYLYI